MTEPEVEEAEVHRLPRRAILVLSAVVVLAAAFAAEVFMISEVLMSLW